MRNPNGFGTVYRLPGIRRRPWCARKTTSAKDGRLVYTYVGYYATKLEAVEALAAYNRAPYDTKTALSAVFDAWSAETYPTLSESSKYAYKAASAYLKPIWSKKISEIRLDDMQPILSGATKATGQHVKVLLSKLFEYAVRHELVSADRHQLVRYLRVSDDRPQTVERTVFTPEEILAVTDPLVLIMLYTGLRVGELLDLRAEDVHLEERWFRVRRAKTAAGVRIVPIAEKIVPCFSSIPAGVDIQNFRKIFKKACPGHLPHDTRHTFISMMANLNPSVDERITKAIVGHAGSGITETVYTHIDLRPMLEAVNRL